MKRRTFLKNVGGAAGAAALGGCATTGKRKSAFAWKKHKQQVTYGIGDDKADDNPDTFSLRRRMPGWSPDAGDPADDLDYMFPEEAIRYDGSKAYELSLPTAPSPTVTNILGVKIKDPKQSAFDSFIWDIANKVRFYNIMLYELRRFHWYKKFNVKPKKNDNGKRPELPDLTDPDFVKQARKAEGYFKTAAFALDQMLDSGIGAQHPFKLVAIDMVQVNKYIVSMRVVATPSIKFLEPGGSDSSHVSIHSPFSSPNIPFP